MRLGLKVVSGNVWEDLSNFAACKNFASLWLLWVFMVKQTFFDKDQCVKKIKVLQEF